MASEYRFRGAFNGFNREDVVRYLEYLNTKHNDLVNQLRSENQALAEELAALRSAATENDDAIPALTEELEAVRAELDELRTKAPVQSLEKEELEAYRRAEKAERAARERAAQLYRQATGILADATAHVDGAAGQFHQIAERVNSQMLELQAAVDNSKNALQDAAAILCAIRPEGSEE